MKQDVRDLLNLQINKELFSSYLYLSIANFFEEKGLSGFANWYNVQALEEKDHAMLFVQYMHNNDAKIVYEALEKPQETWENVLAALKEGLVHEVYITDSINKIYSVALDNKDFRTTQFLDWFIKEQGEEEMNARDLILKTEIVGENGKSLYILDQELAKRVYAAPSLVL